MALSLAWMRSGMRMRLLPAFIALVVISLAFKTGHLAGDVSRFISTAEAQEAAQPDPARQDGETAGPPAAQAQNATDLTAALGGVSRSELDLLEDLRNRRRQLEEREQQAALREQLLASTERRIDQKISDLKTIEEQIRTLVATHQDQENEQLKSIVKVYETMKPKDAAPVFQTLDMDIQEAVAIRMKDSKMAALLSAMDPNKAQELTTRLATSTRLPGAEEILEGS